MLVSSANLILFVVGALVALAILSTAVGVYDSDMSLIDGGALSLLLAGVLAWRVVADLRVEVVRHERGAPVEVRR